MRSSKDHLSLFLLIVFPLCLFISLLTFSMFTYKIYNLNIIERDKVWIVILFSVFSVSDKESFRFPLKNNDTSTINNLKKTF